MICSQKQESCALVSNENRGSMETTPITDNSENRKQVQEIKLNENIQNPTA